MERRQAVVFRLIPDETQKIKLSRYAGSCRYIYNYFLTMKKEQYAQNKKGLTYNTLANMLIALKNAPETNFLKEIHSQVLQQTLIDLDKAYNNFFKGSGYPKYKKRGQRDSFRYPQGVKLNEHDRLIFLPKIGWIK